MRYRIALVSAVALGLVVMTGCAATPDVEPKAVHISEEESTNIDSSATQSNVPQPMPMTPLSTIVVSVPGDVIWEIGSGSGGSTNGDSTIDSQEYVLRLTTEQMVVYTATGNVPGRVTEQVAEVLSPVAVIDAYRLRERYPSVSVTFTVKPIE